MARDIGQSWLTSKAGTQPGDSVILKRPTQKLARSLTVFNGISIVVGIIIGSGIFISPGVVAEVESVGATLAVWTFSGLICCLGGLTYCELGTMYQNSGAEAVFYQEAFGPWASFIFLWTNVFVMRPASIAINGITFARYFSELVFDFDASDSTLDQDWRIKATGMGVVIVVAALNCWSTSVASGSANFMFALKLVVVLVMFVLGGLAFGNENGADRFKDPFQGTTSDYQAWSNAFTAALFSYNGWHMSAWVLSELKDASKSMPIVVFVGMAIVTCAYVGINVAYLAALDLEQVQSSNAIALDLGAAVLGADGGRVVSALVCICTFGGLLCNFFASSRMIQAASADERFILPNFFGYLHPSRNTPIAAIVFIVGLTAITMAMGTFRTLLSYFTFGTWLFYVGSAVALLILRKTRRDKERPIRASLFLVVPFTFFALLIVVTVFEANPVESAIGAAILVSGFPVYLLAKTRFFGCGGCWAASDEPNLYDEIDELDEGHSGDDTSYAETYDPVEAR